MKKSSKWIIAAVVFVVLLIAAAVLYNTLSDEYRPDPLATDSAPTEQQTDAEQGMTGDNAASDTTEDAALTKAPDFVMLNQNGETVRLSDYFGKPIVLNFWATWCYYCKEEMPDFNEAYGEHDDIQFMMVNVTDGYQETLETAKNYIEEQSFSFPVFFDTETEAASLYGLTGLPKTYFIDKNGNLIAHGNGMLTRDALERGIAMITEE